MNAEGGQWGIGHKLLGRAGVLILSLRNQSKARIVEFPYTTAVEHANRPTIDWVSLRDVPGARKTPVFWILTGSRGSGRVQREILLPF